MSLNQRRKSSRSGQNPIILPCFKDHLMVKVQLEPSKFPDVTRNSARRASHADVCTTADNPLSRETPPEITRETRGTTPTTQITFVASMPLVREQLQKLGLSSGTIDIIMASWRKSTGKQYTTYLSRWLTYCNDKKLNVTHATVNNGLDFLTLLFQQGVGYSAINTARSALSLCYHTNCSYDFWGTPPGYKGTFELRPSLPRYSRIWDVALFLHTSKHFQLSKT